jgi:alginate O-acetyltransferase complex protein AlgJ
MEMPVPANAPTGTGRPTPVMEGARIGRRTALGLAVSFPILISIPAVHQLAADLRETGEWSLLRIFRIAPSHESLEAFGEALARDSALAGRARSAWQEVLTAGLGIGSEKVIVGRDGFLFLRKEVDMATGRGFLTPRRTVVRGIDQGGRPGPAVRDPVDAIVDYGRQLAARGVRLIVAPIPLKPFIYPDRAWAGYPLEAGPAWNVDRSAFLERLAEAGVDAVDVTGDLWRARSGGRDLYLRQDTHWTPAGLRVAAGRLAERVRPLLGDVGRRTYAGRPAAVEGMGDLVRMLELPSGGNPFRPETVEVVQALEGDRIARGGDGAPVLLLGDSFVNVYSRRELDWGEGAGLGEALMLDLGTEVQVIAVNGGGATACREALAGKPAALARKKVVVWVFSARDLADEDVTWERVPLP